jgi:DNA-binding PadR family transcriptional regulator
MTDLSQPLTAPVLHLLMALADEDRYGYALMQAVSEQSGGAVRLRTGSLYRYLSQLIDGGLVVEVGSRAGDDPRRGTYYRLTPRGRRLLAAEGRRLATLAAAIEPRLARKGHA